MAKRKKYENHQHEEHADESWLIPYADILTLLLAVFIVLFASSQIDQKKFEQLAQSMSQAFYGTSGILDKNSGLTDNAGVTQANKEREPAQRQINEEGRLAGLKGDIDAYVQQNHLDKQINTQITEDGLLIRISDATFFASGSAELLPQAESFAMTLAGMLGPFSQRVVVSGHTDSIAIHTDKFPTNWHLSNSRALNFMLFLLQQNTTLDPARFSALGYGEYHPLASNETSEGRAKNRRVEILLMRYK